jgi:hypothetical protein
MPRSARWPRGGRLERGYLGTLLRLTLLSPDIVEAILNGQQPDGVNLPRLLEPFPSSWAEQRAVFGTSTPRKAGARHEAHHLHHG